MGNSAMRNYERAMHPTGSLKESVDAIRSSVKELYELDEDNYQMIQNLRKSLDQTNNRVNDVTRKAAGGRVRTFIGVVLLGGVIWGVVKSVADTQNEIKDLRSWVNVLKGAPEKEEESDG